MNTCIHTYVCLYIHTARTHTYVHTHSHTHPHPRTSTHTHTHTHTGTYSTTSAATSAGACVSCPAASSAFASSCQCNAGFSGSSRHIFPPSCEALGTMALARRPFQSSREFFPWLLDENFLKAAGADDSPISVSSRVCVFSHLPERNVKF